MAERGKFVTCRSMSSFSHLHCHTQYSLLDGAASIQSLYKKAVNDKMPAIAITDHGNMFGAFEFVAEAYKHCKPIGADDNGSELIKKAVPQLQDPEDGVITDGNVEEFVAAIMLHRFWDREMNPLPA